MSRLGLPPVLSLSPGTTVLKHFHNTVAHPILITVIALKKLPTEVRTGRLSINCVTQRVPFVQLICSIFTSKFVTAATKYGIHPIYQLFYGVNRTIHNFPKAKIIVIHLPPPDPLFECLAHSYKPYTFKKFMSPIIHWLIQFEIRSYLNLCNA